MTNIAQREAYQLRKEIEKLKAENDNLKWEKKKRQDINEKLVKESDKLNCKLQIANDVLKRYLNSLEISGSRDSYTIDLVRAALEKCNKVPTEASSGCSECNYLGKFDYCVTCDKCE